MGAVTYPDNDVQQYLSDHFTTLKINLLERHPDHKEASGTGKVIFAPTFVFTDGKGREIRRYLGWLPATSFLAELRFARAQHDFNRGQFLPARDLYAEIMNDFADADVAAEATYWHGIAAFLGGNKDGAALKKSWLQVRERYPSSTWATRAEPIDDLPA